MKSLRNVSISMIGLVVVALILTAYRPMNVPISSSLKSSSGGSHIVQARYELNGSTAAKFTPLFNPSTVIVSMYRSPMLTSSIVAKLPPMKGIYIFGSSQDGSFLSVSTRKEDLVPAGWITLTDAIARASSVETHNLVKVYSLPENGGQVIDVLSPAMAVLVLGKSIDGSDYIIAQSTGTKTALARIAVTDLQVASMTGRVRSLIRTTLTANPLGSVYNVLFPNQLVEVLGQNQKGTMLAICSSTDHKFLGWLAASEIAITNEGFNAPVLGQ